MVPFEAWVIPFEAWVVPFQAWVVPFEAWVVHWRPGEAWVIPFEAWVVQVKAWEAEVGVYVCSFMLLFTTLCGYGASCVMLFTMLKIQESLNN